MHKTRDALLKKPSQNRRRFAPDVRPVVLVVVRFPFLGVRDSLFALDFKQRPRVFRNRPQI